MRNNETGVYRIKEHAPEFLAASVAGGNQVLIFPLSKSRIVLLLFDSSGRLLSAEERDGGMNNVSEVLRTIPIATEGATHLAQVAVYGFSVPRYGIAIRHQPEILDEFLANPEVKEPDERYRERTFGQVREWNEQRRFVLATWGKEYWMNADGSVFAT